MLINLLEWNGELEFEVNPTVTYKTYCEFIDFPEVEYDSDLFPISHIIQLVVSLNYIM